MRTRSELLSRFFLGLLLFGAVLLGAFFGFREGASYLAHQQDLGRKQEAELGDALYNLLVNEHQLVEHPLVEQAVDSMQKRLTQDGMRLYRYNYRITVLRKSEPNAFALPGGRIVVHSGLFELAESPEEVAAVLAHELGHVEKRHTVKRLVSQFGIYALLSASGGGGMGADIARMLAQLKYSRMQEEEADRFALQLMEDAAIHPRHLATLFKRLAGQYTGEEPPEILNSHPGLDKRIDLVEDYQPARDFEAQPLDLPTWSTIQAAASRKQQPNQKPNELEPNESQDQEQRTREQRPGEQPPKKQDPGQDIQKSAKAL